MVGISQLSVEPFVLCAVLLAVDARLEQSRSRLVVVVLSLDDEAEIALGQAVVWTLGENLQKRFSSLLVCVCERCAFVRVCVGGVRS